MTNQTLQSVVQPWHEFTVRLLGYTELTDKLERLIYGSIDDCLCRSSSGSVFVDFGRQASSYEEAVAGALAQLTSVGLKTTAVFPDYPGTSAAPGHYTGLASLARAARRK